MRRIAIPLIIASLLMFSGCSMLGSLVGGGDGQSSKATAVQALVTTTRAGVLLMTAAGIAYDAGAFGAPGSERAEETWGKIAAQSVRLSEALTAWTSAVKANENPTSHMSAAEQAIAIIGALLPSRPKKADLENDRSIAVTITSFEMEIDRLHAPLLFRQASAAFGGAR